MGKKKPSRTILYSESYRTFDSSLDKLAYFMGTTEEWYAKQIRIFRRQIRDAKRELPQLEIRIGEFLEKRKSYKVHVSKADEEWFTELA